MGRTTTLQYTGQLRTECSHVRSGSTITTDAPVDNHGKGERFSPTDLLAVSLASCMITVMAIKAAEHHIPFEDVRAEATKVMPSDPRRVQEVEIEITVGDVWTDKQKKLLEKTAIYCPVTYSLHPDVKQTVNFIYTNVNRS